MSYLGRFVRASVLTGLGLAANGCGSTSVNRMVDYDEGRMFATYSKDDSGMVCSFWDDDYARVKVCSMPGFYLDDGKMWSGTENERQATEDDNRACVSECGTLKLEYEKKLEAKKEAKK